MAAWSTPKATCASCRSWYVQTLPAQGDFNPIHCTYVLPPSTGLPLVNRFFDLLALPQHWPRVTRTLSLFETRSSSLYTVLLNPAMTAV